MDQTHRRFNRICAIVALAWLSAVTVAFTKLRYFPCDFGQYYMAGVIARHGVWQELYPDPIPGATVNMGAPAGSTMRPDYARLAHESRADEYELYRFTQPPPAALFFVPLAFLRFFPAYCAFMAVMVLCAWAISLQAGAIHARCAGAASRWTGVVILIVAFSPMAYRILRSGNISPLIGALIGFSVISMLANRPVATALSTSIGAICKYATAVLLPVMVAMREWRALFWTIVISVLICAVTLMIMGTAPFKEFATVVFPNMLMPNPGTTNQSAEAVLMRFCKSSELPTVAKVGYRAAQIITLALILLVIFRAPKEDWKSAPHVCAACAALIAWMLIFSPLLWEHYVAYLMPLWGWLIWEAKQPRRFLLSLITLSLLYVIVPLHVGRFVPHHLITSHSLFGALGMAALGVWTLGGVRET